MSNREINQYFEQIKIFLPTFSKSTKRYLKDLRNSIDDYCKGNPNSSMDDIIEEFGTPQDVVCNYIDCMDSEQLIRQISISKLVKRAIIILLLLAAIGCVCFSASTYCAYLHAKEETITIEETIIE